MEKDNEATVTDDASGSRVGGSTKTLPNDNHKEDSAPSNELLGILRRGDLVRVSAL